ncbi:MAG: acyltransferase family protein [Planctomycetota bacterium]
MTVATQDRLIGLDALRGLSIAAMILVNNPGDWGHVYAPLRHAEWHGCTFTDLVFPTFLFVAGASIAPALGFALRRGRTPAELRVRALRRGAVLVGIGLLLHSFPWVSFGDGGLFERLWSVRIPGVLQRIGVCYAAAALLYLGLPPARRRVVLWGALLLYWPLLALSPTPDGGAPDLATRGDHLAGWLDRAVFGAHVWRGGGGAYDPEGLLSTIPALGTALLGVRCGEVLTGDAPVGDRVRDLLVLGALWTALGAVWGWVFPINKALWTSSYAVFTGGIAATGLGLCTWLADLRGRRDLLHPFVVYGRNALLVFVGSGVLARILGRMLRVGSGDDAESVQRWFHQHALASWADPYVASLLYALLWVLGWYAVLAWLHRRGWIWRV